MKHVLALAFVIGCGGDGGTESTDAASGPTPAANFKGAPLAPLSSGECPKLAKAGEVSFKSGGETRTAIVRFPKDPPPGLPVMFFWHGLGDSAANIDAALSMDEYARKNDVIVVIPQSAGALLATWNLADGGGDVTFYDDMRTCLVQELGADISRFTTTGFSFGALFSTWLTMNRGDTLAAAMTMSGGTDAAIGLPYHSPASDLPVLVMWGGDADNYDAGIVSLDFQEASLDFANGLLADGHVVGECDHGLGHTVPYDYADAMTPWLLDHVYGEPSPFAGGLDGGFPSYCTLGD